MPSSESSDSTDGDTVESFAFMESTPADAASENKPKGVAALPEAAVYSLLPLLLQMDNTHQPRLDVARSRCPWMRTAFSPMPSEDDPQSYS